MFVPVHLGPGLICGMEGFVSVFLEFPQICVPATSTGQTFSCRYVINEKLIALNV